jgi:hypothetical protein
MLHNIKRCNHTHNKVCKTIEDLCHLFLITYLAEIWLESTEKNHKITLGKEKIEELTETISFFLLLSHYWISHYSKFTTSLRSYYYSSFHYHLIKSFFFTKCNQPFLFKVLMKTWIVVAEFIYNTQRYMQANERYPRSFFFSSVRDVIHLIIISHEIESQLKLDLKTCIQIWFNSETHFFLIDPWL